MSDVVHLGYVADVVSGVGFPKEMQGNAEGEVPVFKVGDISIALKSGTRHLRRSPNHLSNEAAKRLSKTLMPTGTTVFAKIGEGLKLNRRGILAQPSLVDNNVMGLIPKAGVVSPDYLYYFMQTVDLGELSQATAIPSIRKSDVVEIRIPLRAIGEQERIVAEIEKQFSRLDEAVAGLKRVKANLKRYKAAILKAAVEGRLVPTEADLARREVRNYETGTQLLQRILETRRSQWQGKGRYKEPVEPDVTDLTELPEGWVKASLDQLASKITSGSRDWSPFYNRGSSIFVMAQNVRPMSPDFSVLQFVDPPKDDSSCNRSRIEVGDLLLTIVGANAGQVCVISQLPGDSYVCQSVALIRPAMIGISQYLNLWLNSKEHGQQYFESCMYGQGRPHLSFEQLTIATVSLPSLAEQHRIVAEVDRLLSIAREVEAEVEANLKRAQALRQAILSKAFTEDVQ